MHVKKVNSTALSQGKGGHICKAKLKAMLTFVSFPTEKWCQ
jgi:hypothetical protein